MTFGSLFAGIGGMDLGLERAGMTCRWQVEIDPFGRQILTKHWPEVERFHDVKLVGSELESVDVIAGGFPCQPVSSAGKKEAQQDPRWLWPEVMRLANLLKPRFILLENVPGLLGRGLSIVLSDLSRSGFDAEWRCITASEMGGLHHRKRVFVLAYPNGFGTETPFLSPRISMSSKIWGRDQLSYRSNGDIVRPVPDGRIWGVPYGFPQRLDALRGLGNAVCPPVAEWIGRRIIEAAR